jgi:3-deoxy-D-manno-octulosonate 8-phosphate phosphatase (KDO 8-P phosphatase)
MDTMDAELADKLRGLKLLLLDVDGVLTDGRLIYTDGGAETKAFHARDGYGLKLLMSAGVRVGIVTGRSSDLLFHRCRNLGIDLIYDGVADKAAPLAEIQEKTGLSAAEIAFMGDDLPDLPLLRRVGCAITVADAPPPIPDHVDLVTRRKGGDCAVREVCEAILRAKGVWATIIERLCQ